MHTRYCHSLACNVTALIVSLCVCLSRSFLSLILMDDSTTTGHSFCSECVRLHFHTQATGIRRQTSCPECRFPVANPLSVLIPNRAFQVAVQNYKDFLEVYRRQQKEQLLRAAENPVSSSERREINDAPGCNGRTTRSQLAPRLPVVTNTTCSDHENDDQALKMQRMAMLQPRPRTSYAGLKKKQLQALCAAERIGTFGSEDDLKARHQRFMVMWTSEADAPNPKSRQEVAQIFNQEESVHRTEASKFGIKQQSMHMEKLKASRAKAEEGAVVSSGNSQFDEQFKSGFGKLIAQTKHKLLQGQNNKGFSKVLAMSSSSSTMTAELGSTSSEGACVGPRYSSTAPSTDSSASTVPLSSTTDTTKGGHGASPCIMETTWIPGLCPGTAVQWHEKLGTPPSTTTTDSSISKTFSASTTTEFGTSEAARVETQRGSTAALINPYRSKLQSSTPTTSNGNVGTNQLPLATGMPTSYERTTSQSHQNPRTLANATTTDSSMYTALPNQTLIAATSSRKRTWNEPPTVAVTTTGEVHQSSLASAASSKQPRRMARSIAGPWTCNVCTFFNQNRTYATATCEMCAKPRGARGLLSEPLAPPTTNHGSSSVTTTKTASAAGL
jgi:hypothetical protein